MPDNKINRPNRSVVDYDSEEALRRALLAVEAFEQGGNPSSIHDDAVVVAATAADPTNRTCDVILPSNSTSSDNSIDNDNGRENENLDWVLPSFDPETTEAQSMKEELQRLQVLKSYLILDADREIAFERITQLASRIFHVPIALISLVDLGRQWFLSQRGLGDTRETPRKQAFCAHAILSKTKMLIVPDATKDFRFKDNPLVTGSPNIRFYAGAALISPEGYKLGTVCIISDEPRPEGLTPDEQLSLMDLANMAVEVMVDRRAKLERRENPAELIAYAAHDLMTPLTGVQLSLSLLSDDEDVQRKLGSHQLELISTATNCADLMIRICKTMDSLRRGVAAEAAEADTFFLPCATSDGNSAATNAEIPQTNITDLVKSLNMIMEPIPKQVPLVIRLDPNVPRWVVSDDLKLFRSALNLLSSATSRTKTGYIQLRIFVRNEGDGDKMEAHQESTGSRLPRQQHQQESQHVPRQQQLVFECEDTGEDIAVEEYQHLFQPSRAEDGNLRLCLSSVANLISSLDGLYGFYPRREAVLSGNNHDGAVDGATPRPLQVGSVFWFSIPLLTPENFLLQGGSSNGGAGGALACPKNASNPAGWYKPPIIPVSQDATHSTSSTAVTGTLTGTSHIPLDVFQTEAVSHSCFGEVFAPKASDKKNRGHTKSASGGSASSLTIGQAATEALRRQELTKPGTSQPVPARPDALAASTQQSFRPPRQQKALVIDDSLVIRKSLAMALKKLKYDVTQAVDGLDGLNKLKENPFDLVLCDFLMPVMDGFDCVKQYRSWERKNRSWFRQLIVGISAHANENVAAQGIAAGMDDFHPKPISIKTLKEIDAGDDVKKCSRQLDEHEAAMAETVMEPPSGHPLLAVSQPAAVLPPRSQSLASLHSFSSLSGGGGAGTVGRKRDNSFDISARSVGSATKPFEKTPSWVALKRSRLASGSIPGSEQCVCLIATDRPTKQSSAVLTSLEAHGWKVVVVHDGQDALRLLQMRNWDAVLIDEELPLLSGCQCIAQFRQWEAKNRVNRQKNAVLVVDLDIPSPSDGMSTVQPPSGFDFVLSKPVVWNDLKQLLETSEDSSLAIIMNG